VNLGDNVLQLASLNQYRIPRFSANNNLPSAEAMCQMSEYNDFLLSVSEL
jgi:hypothetical protein